MLSAPQHQHHKEPMRALLLHLLFSVVVLSICFCQNAASSYSHYSPAIVNNNVHSVHSVGNGLKDATLDKIKLVRHIPSGKCLVMENRDPPVGKYGEKVVLWECHDVKHIAGLEQEMFTIVKGVDNGYMLMGLAGSLNHCPFAGPQYYDTVEIGKCDPTNAYMSWTFRRIEGTVDSYQILHLVSGRCLRVAGSAHDGAWIRSGDCDINDPLQSWRVCGLDNDCSFTF